MRPPITGSRTRPSSKRGCGVLKQLCRRRMMSKSEPNEEQGLSAIKDSGPSRRRFIRNIAIGTAGAAIAMSKMDRLRRASRVLERLTKNHLQGVLEHIKDITETPQTKQKI